MLLATIGSHFTNTECSSAPGQLQAHVHTHQLQLIYALPAFPSVVSVHHLWSRQLIELPQHLVGCNYTFSNEI